MKIKDLQPRTGNADIEGEITAVEPPRTFSKFGKEGRVANATLKDDSGSIILSLWNDQIDQVKVGDRVKITKGWVSEWQGENQLSTGKFGSLEVISSSDSQEDLSGNSSGGSAGPEPKGAPSKQIQVKQRQVLGGSKPRAIDVEDVSDDSEDDYEISEEDV